MAPATAIWRLCLSPASTAASSCTRAPDRYSGFAFFLGGGKIYSPKGTQTAWNEGEGTMSHQRNSRPNSPGMQTFGTVARI